MYPPEVPTRPSHAPPELQNEPFPRFGEGDRYPGDLGGKGRALDRLRRRALPVPEGFVVPVEVHWAAIREPGMAAVLARLGKRLEQRECPTPADLLAGFPELTCAAGALRPRIEASLARWSGPPPRWLAVRSSATREDGGGCSFAGVLRSWIGVRPVHLAEAVLLCWASACTRRFRGYCRLKELDPAEVAVGVIVQAVARARSAGVLLTHDPVSGERQTVINAVRGLGGGLVDGCLAPDAYRRRLDGSWEVDRSEQPWMDGVTDQGPQRMELPPGKAGRPVLGPREREGLRRLGEQVGQEMGGPQDLEWAIEAGRLWLLQARPITMLPTPSRVWTRANFKELYPELPSPMIASLMQRYKSEWLRDQFRERGFHVEHLGPPVRLIRGRLLFNQTLLEGISRSVGFGREVVEESVGGAGDTTAPSPSWQTVLRHAGPLARLVTRYLRTPASVERILGEARREAHRLMCRPADGRSDAAILATTLEAFRLTETLDIMTSDLMGALGLWTVFSQRLLAGVVDAPDRFLSATTIMDEDNPAARQIAGFEELVAQARREPAVLAWLGTHYGPPLCQGERTVLTPFSSGPWRGLPAELQGTGFGGALERFLRDHGTRTIHESDSAIPRYAEDPALLLASIYAAAQAPEAASGETRERRLREAEREAWAELAARLCGWERRFPARVWLLRAVTRRIRRLYALREHVRLEITRLIAALRRFQGELGARWARRGWLDAPEEIHWLRIEDAARAVAGPRVMESGWLRAQVARHRAEHRDWAAGPLPDVWIEGGDPALSPPADRVARGAPLLHGMPLSPGVIEGEVALVSGPEMLLEIPPGRILVLPVVGPSWTPLFATARGVVVEMAGVLSHGAILLREYGLPTVANVPGVTHLLRDGERIRVDGTSGTVERLEGGEEVGEPSSSAYTLAERRRAA